MCRRESDHGGNRGEHERLDEQLRDDPRPAGSERISRGDFRLARGGASVDERAYIGAGDDQHEQDRHVREGELDPSPIARRLAAVRQHPRLQVLVCQRGVGRRPFDHCRDLRVGLRLRRAGRESAEHPHRRAVEWPIAGAPHLKRHPQAVVDRKREAVRHDADDGRRGVSELQGLSDHVDASTESLAPHVVAKDDHGRGARLLIGIEQRPSQERRHTNELKGRRGDLGDGHWFGSRIAENQVTFDRAIRAKIDDGSQVALPDHEVVKHAPLVSATGEIAHLDFDDALAVGERNRGPQDVARQVVPAGADADGHRERQPARESQARILQ
jgi:hypothetical protein